jgi:hypothetical protein
MWPEVARVIKPLAFSCGAKARTGATSRPNRSVIGPSGESQGAAPHSNAGKEVALAESVQIFGSNFGDRSLIHFSRRDDVLVYQFPQPCCFLRIVLVVPVQSVVPPPPPPHILSVTTTSRPSRARFSRTHAPRAHRTTNVTKLPAITPPITLQNIVISSVELRKLRTRVYTAKIRSKVIVKFTALAQFLGRWMRVD